MALTAAMTVWSRSEILTAMTVRSRHGPRVLGGEQPSVLSGPRVRRHPGVLDHPRIWLVSGVNLLVSGVLRISWIKLLVPRILEDFLDQEVVGS